MPENSFLSIFLPAVPMAFFVNVILDFVKKRTPCTRPAYLLPSLCLALGVIAAALYLRLMEGNAAHDQLTAQSFSIIGLSYFFYDAKAYDIIKKFFMERVECYRKSNKL